MSEHGHTSEEKPSVEKKSGATVSAVPSWAWLALIGICLFIVSFALIHKAVNNRKEKRANEKAEIINNNAKSIEHNYTYKIINFTGEYGEIVYLPSGCMFAFIYATESYCVINSKNYSECGEKEQDISTKMGDTFANTELRFKSQNGKAGTLTIRIRDK